MSGNDDLHLAFEGKKTDARVRRTRDALGDALVALMQEKPFDSITVQDVLDRAQVGRSTFYAHYSDKDDLLMSDADEFFEGVSLGLSAKGETSDRVFPVREFFSHIAEAKQFVNALSSAGKLEANLELARGHFARGIERRLSELPRGQAIPEHERSATAFAHAGALLSLMTWWIDRGMKQSPAEMEELFHRIVWGQR
ncbi:MAG TPA: TetR/AcrR family transcriptional regulator [Pyrinomonadaceae bacterium]|nr:TetR/AcrR family transcriptional regulator [Pyrinomonadaceae bacterium]